MFLDFLLWGTFLVYVIFMLNTVVRIHDEWGGFYCAFYMGYAYWWRPRFFWRFFLIRFLFWIVGVSLEFLIAPFLWIHFRGMDKERAETKAKAEEENRIWKEREKQRENERRAAARKWWLESNPPKLFLKTMNGITAVLRPSDYEECQVITLKASRDERWESKNILLPWRAFIFFQKSGKNHIARIKGYDERWSGNGVLCAWLSEFEDFVRENNIQLETKDDIFVPFVNETLLPFEEHKHYSPGYGNDGDWRSALLLSQIPAELRPVT